MGLPVYRLGRCLDAFGPSGLSAGSPGPTNWSLGTHLRPALCLVPALAGSNTVADHRCVGNLALAEGEADPPHVASCQWRRHCRSPRLLCAVGPSEFSL